MRSPSPTDQRLRAVLQGAVQGVGFRPFVFRLAAHLGLRGWVLNDGAGVTLEVEGAPGALERFEQLLERDRPRAARVERAQVTRLEPVGYERLEIRSSDGGGGRSVLVLPDLATCPACLDEVAAPGDRRHRYPFTNCTDCGPRFSIVEALPYDRPGTTMRGFALCGPCAREYRDPADRRFHAQPNACPACGPRLTLVTPAGDAVARDDGALRAAADALRAGSVVAVKGIGGFHLLVDAASADAVATLRRRKGRPAKALAVMAPDLDAARLLADVSPAAAAALADPAAPIVLLPRRQAAPLAAAVAPDVRTVGVVLPYSPLHHLLLREVGRPLVFTSGNHSEEPLCTDEARASDELGDVADLLLVHDRPIARPVDDSVAWLLRGRLRLLRRARGYAPLPLPAGRPLPSVLAVGGHQKGCVALSHGEHVFVSQHLGDLEGPAARGAFRRAATDLVRLYGAAPLALAHDLHPDYASTRWALDEAARLPELAGLPRAAVQHHHAHLAACLLEHQHPGEALGVVWDGSGDGGDGTVWGGEFLRGDARGVTRVAHLRPFALVGGEAAVREPRRVGLALGWELWGADWPPQADARLARGLTPSERAALLRLLSAGLRSPRTTSAGRLFDGVAALVGLHPRATYEGQAAVALEALADPAVGESYPLPLDGDAAPRVLDWGPLVTALAGDVARGVSASRVSARFHNALAEGIVTVARWVGAPTVALTGGCFQSRLLTERAAERLEAAGFRVLLHRELPPNDGGLAAGQVAVAAARIEAQAHRGPPGASPA